MTAQEIQLLYEYDRWANDRSLNAAASLTKEQVTRDLGGAFSSIRDTLLHVIAGEWVWLQYWKEASPNGAFLEKLRTRRAAAFDPKLFPSIVEIEQKWREVEKEQIGFVSGVTDDRLNEMVPFRKTEITLAQLMQHVANHSTYHRGQVSLMMRQLGAKPVATDFHEFLVDEARSMAQVQA